MSVYIAGLICALVLAALVVIWMVYCMFVRERHKSEYYQYNISDLKHRHLEQAMEQENMEKVEKKGVTAGIFILPSRHKQKDEYEMRPDYPESPVHKMDTGTDKLIEIFNDSTADIHYKDGIVEVDNNAAYHSDV